MAAITNTQLNNASTDAQSLEDFINGDPNRSNPGNPNGTITTRLGRVVKTIARAVLDVFNWQGTWSSGTTYDVGHVVSRTGASYISLQASNLNHAPESSPTYWALLAAKGDTGATGAQGPSGPQGQTGQQQWIIVGKMPSGNGVGAGCIRFQDGNYVVWNLNGVWYGTDPANLTQWTGVTGPLAFGSTTVGPSGIYIAISSADGKTIRRATSLGGAWTDVQLLPDTDATPIRAGYR